MKSNADRFLFVYDTLTNPITFDFLHNLYCANWLRHRSGRAYLDILLVSRRDIDQFQIDSYVAAVGRDNVQWRLTNLIIPLARLFSSVDRIFLVDAKEAFAIVESYDRVHPVGYGPVNPKTAAFRLDEDGLVYFPALTIAPTARAIVEAYYPWSDSRRIVTVTLRTYDYITTRNSTISAWVAFARELDPQKYRVVFIPDASKDGVGTVEQLRGFDVFDAACWNIELRAAMYERAWMNMGIQCGPLTLSALLEGVRTVLIDRTLDFPPDYRAGIAPGLVPGQRPKIYSSSCYVHLGKDDKETIERLFREHAT